MQDIGITFLNNFFYRILGYFSGQVIEVFDSPKIHFGRRLENLFRRLEYLYNYRKQGRRSGKNEIN